MYKTILACLVLPEHFIFEFLVESKDYYVQLDLISPTGKIVESVNSDMLN